MCDFYTENGPSALASNFLLSPQDPFGEEGYFAMLVGQQVPHQRMGEIGAADHAAWRRVAQENASIAAAGFTVKEALACIRRPDWSWG